jgi:SAM-dependent methyltransferase
MVMDTPVWDQIYQDYKNGGTAWATLGGGLEPHFKEFISKTKFKTKSAFDIGYGTGQYLQFLKLQGFKVAGIDSSQTAHDMAEESVGSYSELLVGNMYEYKITSEAYDLILSISTIHHGTKDQISRILSRVYEALLNDGYAYITLPINNSSNEWMTFKDKDEIAPGTYAPNSGPEKGLPHSFYSKDEVVELFSKYKSLSLDKVEGRWHITAQK